MVGKRFFGGRGRYEAEELVKVEAVFAAVVGEERHHALQLLLLCVCVCARARVCV